MKILSISDKIKNNTINLNNYKNMHDFADKHGMMLRKIPLKDGSNALLLANQKELDCLIMQNGKIVASRGVFGKLTDEPCLIACNILDHIKKKNIAAGNIDITKECMIFIGKFIYKYM